MYKKILFTALAAILTSGVAHATNSTTYNVTITNGGNMPISPGVLYGSRQALPADQVGQTPTAGFVQLCETGNTEVKAAELRNDPHVRNVVQTSGPIFPGESRSFEIRLRSAETLHFATMYGKTKDLCGVLTVDRRSLRDVANRILPSALAKEQVVASGAFADPVIPAGGFEEAESLCAQSTNGIQCLRALSSPAEDQKTRFFSGYLPSLVSFLEGQYGAMDVQTLIVPTSGAIQLQVQLKH